MSAEIASAKAAAPGAFNAASAAQPGTHGLGKGNLNLNPLMAPLTKDAVNAPGKYIVANMPDDHETAEEKEQKQQAQAGTQRTASGNINSPIANRQGTPQQATTQANPANPGTTAPASTNASSTAHPGSQTPVGTTQPPTASTPAASTPAATAAHTPTVTPSNPIPANTNTNAIGSTPAANIPAAQTPNPANPNNSQANGAGNGINIARPATPNAPANPPSPGTSQPTQAGSASPLGNPAQVSPGRAILIDVEIAKAAGVQFLNAKDGAAFVKINAQDLASLRAMGGQTFGEVAIVGKIPPEAIKQLSSEHKELMEEASHILKQLAPMLDTDRMESIVGRRIMELLARNPERVWNNDAIHDLTRDVVHELGLINLLMPGTDALIRQYVTLFLHALNSTGLMLATQTDTNISATEKWRRWGSGVSAAAGEAKEDKLIEAEDFEAAAKIGGGGNIVSETFQRICAAVGGTAFAANGAFIGAVSTSWSEPSMILGGLIAGGILGGTLGYNNAHRIAALIEKYNRSSTAA